MGQPCPPFHLGVVSSNQDRFHYRNYNRNLEHYQSAYSSFITISKYWLIKFHLISFSPTKLKLILSKIWNPPCGGSKLSSDLNLIWNDRIDVGKMKGAGICPDWVQNFRYNWFSKRHKNTSDSTHMIWVISHSASMNKSLKNFDLKTGLESLRDATRW